LNAAQSVSSPSAWWRSALWRKFFIPLSAGLFVLCFVPAFFSPVNLLNLLRQVSINGIIASGMTVVMVAGGFDLSVGSVVALAGVLAIQFAKQSLVWGIGIPLAMGTTIGCVNGGLVGFLGINPLIATLGSRYLVYAAANLLTSGFIQYNESPAFLWAGRANWLRVPMPIVIFAAVLCLIHILLRHTIVGAALYAVGSNERAAFFSGLPSRTIRVAGYLVTGICSALAGVVLASRLGIASPDAGEGYELDAIAAVVLGGTSMFGGTGGVGRTLTGVLLLGTLSNLLVLAGQSYEVQRIASGAVIVAAVAFDPARRR